MRIVMTKNPDAIRILIVDDHHVVRMGLQSMFRREADMRVIGLAASGEEAIQRAIGLEFDILLTDMRMPGMEGADLIATLLKTHSRMRAIVLTNYHSDEDVFRAVKMGALGYLLKTSHMEEVLEAIRSVHAGKRWIPAHLSEQLSNHLMRETLSARELEVLQLLAQGMRNREIGTALGISENTVRNHVINLLDKLGTTNRTEGVTMALQQGIIKLKA